MAVSCLYKRSAGKSSLTVALFRLVEIESGQIKLDGIDLATVDYTDIRGRPGGMAIIPQDPFLAGGTLRRCIDPFHQNCDSDILEALKAVRLSSDSDSVSVLDVEVEEGGSNYSVGERQLLNLARALLSRPKVLVLDEATAALDPETDAFIQQMLRTKFVNTTQITIAHRLESVMDYDQIVVMNHGRAAEVGSPRELLALGGLFADLIDSTGPKRSELLRAMVKDTDST
jgi:ABC-type multidrug transport system fused ATPase/permease subunit